MYGEKFNMDKNKQKQWEKKEVWAIVWLQTPLYTVY